MIKKIFRVESFQIGEGAISGYIASFLAILSFLGVLAFHFPQYLTTPDLRANYNTDFIRQIMFVSLVIAGSLGLLNFVRNKNKRLGATAWCFVIATLSLGGHQVEVQEYDDVTYS